MIVAYHKGFNKFYSSDDGLAWSTVKQLGRKQANLLEFACKYKGLHTYAKAASKQVAALVARGLIAQYPDSQQFEAVNGRTI